MAALSLVFDLLGRDVSASRAFRDVGDNAERTSKRVAGFGSSMSGAFKLAGAALLGAGLAEGFKYIYEQAAESAKIGRITTQVIASTGGAAKITAKQVGDLSTAISNKTGVDDEAIQSGENLLLTFTGIRNEVGKGNDIFNQATSIVTDMSAALGQDMKSSAIQVGKALNDPIKGVTALQRVGVSFTSSQKEQIKTLVDSGKTMDAQKLILKELGREFGGAAAAASTPLDKLKVNLGNLAEQVGGYVIPIVNKFATFFLDTLLPGIQSVAGWLGDKLGPAFKTIGDYAGQVFNILFKGDFKHGPLDEDSPFVNGLFIARDWLLKVRDAFAAAFGWLKANALPILMEVGAFLADTFGPLWRALSDYYTQHLMPAIKGVWSGFQTLWPIIKVIGEVLGALVVVLVKYVLPILVKVSGFVLDVLVVAFKTLATTVRWLWENVLKPTWAAISVGWDALGKAFRVIYDKVIHPVFDAFGKVIEAIKNGFSTAVQSISNVWDTLSGMLKKPVQVVVDVVWNNGLRALWNTINNIWGGKDIAPFKFADGGMMPGYTPGRDVHKFYSPTAGMLELSGGEPVLRPEAGAVLGRGWVDGINSAARKGGKSGVARFLGGYADGGMVSLGDRALGWMGSGIGSVLTSLFVPGGSMVSQLASYVAKEKAATANRGGSPIYGLVGDLFRTVANSLWGVVKTSISALGSNFGAGTPASQAPASQASNVATVRSWASPYGWDSGAEWDALVSVINRESGFRNTAQNPRSSAYGMFQFLDSTWPAFGFSKTSDPVRQAMAGMKYISQVYGDPLGALRHEQAFGWYDNGGWLKPGLTMAYNGTGKPERIRTAEQEAALHSGPMEITGTLRFDADGLVHIVDGRLVEFETARSHRGTYNPGGGW